MVDSSADVPKESSRTILFQFVVFPLGVVLVGVAIFLLFGKLASDARAIPDYLNDIRSGSKHERWQAAYELSKSLKRGEAKRYPNLEQEVGALYVSSRDDDPRIRRYLSMVLGNLGDRRATPLLLASLSDRDPGARIYAILALGELRDPAAVPALIGVAHDEDKDVRKTALYALGGIGDPRAVDTLAGALQDETADVRWNAAVALARFGDRRAIGTLQEMLDRTRLNRVPDMREDQKEDTIIMGITEYAKLAGHDALPQLQRLATTDPSLRVQGAAKGAIEQILRRP